MPANSRCDLIHSLKG